MLRWVGRTALVTGAYTGIGGGISKALIEKGVNVVGCGRSLESLNDYAKELKGLPGNFVPVKCDITKEEEVLEMLKVAKKEFDGVDICVNVAGVGFGKPLLEGKVEHWQQMINTKLIGQTLVTREAVKSMREKGINDGHVINIGSVFGQYLPKNRPTSHFNAMTHIATKALTEGTKNELCENGKDFRVTELSPGWVETTYEIKMRGVEGAKASGAGVRPMYPKDIGNAVLWILGLPPHVNISQMIIETTDPWP